MILDSTLIRSDIWQDQTIQTDVWYSPTGNLSIDITNYYLLLMNFLGNPLIEDQEVALGEVTILGNDVAATGGNLVQVETPGPVLDPTVPDDVAEYYLRLMNFVGNVVYA